MTAATDERRLVAEPIMAWKRAMLADLPDGGIGFRPLSATGFYGTTETAECRPVPGITPGTGFGWWDRGGRPAVPTHDAPHPDCACGFYATRDRRDPPTGEVNLRVALTGTVIVHQRGYRAQRQQVVAVEIPEACSCGSTRVVGILPCEPYRPVCHACAPDPTIMRLMSRADLAGALCVDVAWCASGGPSTASFTVHFTATGAAFQSAMNRMALTAQQAAQQMQTAFAPSPATLWIFDDLDEDDDGPVHPLEAKRRRDEARRQRLEQLAGPRRGPRTIPANRRR